MGIVNMIQTIKLVHKFDVILVKIGKFYQVYGKDAYIVSYLFGYKLKKVENVMMCGFSLNSLNKIIARLENIDKDDFRNIIVKVEDIINERRKISSN